MRINRDDDFYGEINPEIYDNLSKLELNERIEEYQAKKAAENHVNGRKTQSREKDTIKRSLIPLVVYLFLVLIFSFVNEYFGGINIEFSYLIPIAFIIALVAVFGIFIYYFIKQKTSPKSIDDYFKINPIENEDIIRDGFTPINFQPDSFDPPDRKPSPYISPKNFTSEITTFLSSSDSTFDAKEFIEWCKKSFFIFWEAWSQNNIEAARIFLNDDLFEKTRSLLKDNIEHNRKDIYRVYNLAGCFINRYERESGFEYLTVYLTSIHRHYILDTRRNSNIPIEGSDIEDVKTIYQLKFLRRFNLDQKTHIKNGVQSIICPNCGAEVTALNMGRCEFCNSVIKASEFSWVLSDIDEYLRNTTPVDNRGVIIRTNNF